MKAVPSLLAVLVLGGGAVAQETIALAIEGWRARRATASPTIGAQAICAAGSVVSYKAQPHRTTYRWRSSRSTTAGSPHRTRERAHPRRAHLRRQGAHRRGRACDAGLPRGRLGRQHHDLHDEVAPDRAGAKLQPGERSPKREWTANNFEGFLRSMVASPA